MLWERIEQKLSIRYESRLLIFDRSQFSDTYDFIDLLHKHGYLTFADPGIEEFRVIYERDIRYSDINCALIVTDEAYIPYDIRKAFYSVDLSLASVFPYLDASTLYQYRDDLELISIAYDNLYANLNSQRETEAFIKERAFTQNIIERYQASETAALRVACEEADSYTDWINIAKRVAKLNYYGAIVNENLDLKFIDELFESFILSQYGQLSGVVNKEFPVILPKALNFITQSGTKKVAFIVMDAMSLFDFEVLTRYLKDFRYDYKASYTLIPTMTSVSRQSLLSGKYPQQLSNPFTLNGEEKGFVTAGLELGYPSGQIQYLRGYEPSISPIASLVCIVINEVDDVVHGQHHGRTGMLKSMNVIAESGRLQKLIRSLFIDGFTVYITADHGNTPCKGVGSFRSGVEAETKSKRMVVLRDFAEENDFLRENTILYPGYYLDKSYRYYLCKHGVSFDNKGDEVMTHGGLSIDEVIVPFIKITEV